MRLEVTEPAEKDIAKLDRKIQRRIGITLDRLVGDIRALNLKKLQGKGNVWRVTVRDWRVLVEFNWKKGIIYVLHVLHRREAYRKK